MNEQDEFPSEKLTKSRFSIANSERSDISRLSIVDSTNFQCRQCRNKAMGISTAEHSPIDCLSQRCALLESEIVKLKDREIKSRIQIKELDSKIAGLEEAIQGLTAPKQVQAAPFNFSSGQKIRNPFKKSLSLDVTANEQEVNFDNILPPKRSTSRERLGLFGSLGASSQHR